MAYVKKPTLIAETPLGPLMAHFNSGTNIHFNQDGEQVLTINRVPYTAYFTAEFAEGQWQIARHKENGTLSGPSSLRIQRAGSFSMADYSASAWNKAEAVLGEWLAGWVADQTLILAEAEHLDAIAATQEAQEACARAAEVLRVANEKLKAAEARCEDADENARALKALAERVAPDKLSSYITAGQ